VSVGKPFQTDCRRRDRIGQILQAAPALMPIIGPTYFKFRDFPGAKEISELLKKVREKEMPGLDAEEGQQPSPDQLKAQIEGMGQQMQQMGQAMQAMQMELQTEQAKQQAQIMKAQLDAQTRMGEAQLDAETKGPSLPRTTLPSWRSRSCACR
jgi:rubrerythrin